MARLGLKGFHDVCMRAGPFVMLIILAVIIAVLSVLIILLVYYNARDHEQRQGQQRAAQQQGVLTVDAFSGYVTMQGEAASMQADFLPSSRKHPTPSGIISSLPLIKYQPLGTGSTQVCAICFEDFHADEDIKLLPCMHSYHGACIDAWLNRSHTCPMCNRDVTQAAAAGIHTTITVEAA